MSNNLLLKNASTYFGANVINGLIPFILLPILTRYLTVEAYGQVAIFQTLYWAVSAFVGITIAGASDRKFFDAASEKHLADFIGACVQICLFLTLTTIGFFIIFNAQFSNITGTPPEYIFYAIIVAASLSIIQIRLGQWQIRGKAKIFGFFQILQSSLIVILSVLLIVYLSLDEIGRIFSQVLICGAFAITSIILLRKDKLLNFFTWNPQYIKESLQFAIPLIPHVAGVFLISMADRFFIAGELGVDQAGIYMLAAQLATVVSLVHESINRAFLPWLFEKLAMNKIEDKKLIVKYTYLWFVAILLTSPILFFIGPSIVIIIAGPQYSEAGNIFGWLALGHSFGGMYAMLNCYIYFSKKTYSLSIVTLFSGILNIILLIFFLKIYGLIGAGIAFSISMLVRFFLTWLLAQYVHPMPWLSFRKQGPSTH